LYRPAPAADGGTCWCTDVVAIRECVRPIPGCARKRGASQQLGSSRKSRLRGRVVGSPGQNRTSRLLKDELLFQRATQVYLWARPLVNALGMKARSEKGLGSKPPSVVVHISSIPIATGSTGSPTARPQSRRRLLLLHRSSRAIALKVAPVHLMQESAAG